MEILSDFAILNATLNVSGSVDFANSQVTLSSSVISVVGYDLATFTNILVV